MERDEFGEFLRQRRALLQPGDVGLPAGPQRRAPGLRRPEVADLAGLSAGYYVRLEQGRHARPSARTLDALARALRLTRPERDHLFRLAGRSASADPSEYVRPGVLRIVDALNAVPVQVVSGPGVVLVQNRLAAALLGDQSAFTGMDRSGTYRWFTDPGARAALPVDDHRAQSRLRVAWLREAVDRNPHDRLARRLVRTLGTASPEFAALWSEAGGAPAVERLRVLHPAVGLVDLSWDVLMIAGDGQRLLVLTARPGSPAAGQLELLGVIGQQRF
jgi:transcriptional regulator with XRE-family HTH domain